MRNESGKKRLLREAIMDLSEHLGDMIHGMFGGIEQYCDADEELDDLNAKGTKEYSVGFVNGARWARDIISEWLDEGGD